MEEYVSKSKENAKKRTAEEISDAASVSNQFKSETDKNIVESAVTERKKNAASALLKILSDYNFMTSDAQVKKDKNLATAALLTAKARISLLKSELNNSVGQAETEYKKSYNGSLLNAATTKNKNTDIYNNLRINNLKAQIREV